MRFYLRILPNKDRDKGQKGKTLSLLGQPKLVFGALDITQLQNWGRYELKTRT